MGVSRLGRRRPGGRAGCVVVASRQADSCIFVMRHECDDLREFGKRWIDSIVYELVCLLALPLAVQTVFLQTP